MIIPAQYQPKLPVDRLILYENPKPNAVELDVLFVGAGPAGLSGAIELSKRMEDEDRSIQIGVIEKASALGEHCLSGAIINPRVFHNLFPELNISDFPFQGPVPGERFYYLTENQEIRLPVPPPMRNRGNFVASICEMVRWLGSQAESRGVHIFLGFPAQSLLVRGKKVVGVRTAPGANNSPSTDIKAKVTVLCEGTRGSLTQAYLQKNKIASPNPAIFSLGVKELWQTTGTHPLNEVIHTVGWPLPKNVFGGSFLYPMGNNLVSFGIVVSLDYHQTSFDIHDLLRKFKKHPRLQSYIEGGMRLEWGAKTIPEGGFYSVPEKLFGDGILIAGDAAGFVNVGALKGIHYAMESGILAARTIFEAMKANDVSENTLSTYDEMLNRSFIMEDLYEWRNLRLAFRESFVRGGFKASLMTLTRGNYPRKRIEIESDAHQSFEITSLSEEEEKRIQLSKVDSVFYSGNATRDDIPRHLIVKDDIPEEVGKFYQHMCPAGVFEYRDGALVVNAPNCIDCKATDVLGPRWMPREGGSGPRYRKM